MTYTPIDAELLIDGRWTRQSLNVIILGNKRLTSIVTDDGKIYSPAFWRIYGTKPTPRIKFSRFSRRGGRGRKPKVVKRYEEPYVAGPFMQKELPWARKMLLSHPDCFIKKSVDSQGAIKFYIKRRKK